MKHTEKTIIRALYRYHLKKQHNCCIHNSTGLLSYTGEIDFASINKSGLITEVEIKTSRADFLNDFRNKNRHDHLANGYMTRLNTIERKNILTLNGKVRGYYSIKCVEVVEKTIGCLPNYFFFAFPEGMIDINDVPEYAGIILIDDNGRPHQKRRAKRIHKDQITERQKQYLMRALTYRMNRCINSDSSAPEYLEI